jgi:hypothetical protein
MPDHPLSTMRKLDPEFMKHLDDADALVYADGALPRRFSCYGGSLSSSTSGADRSLPGTLPSFRQVPDGV